MVAVYWPILVAVILEMTGGVMSTVGVGVGVKVGVGVGVGIVPPVETPITSLPVM